MKQDDAIQEVHLQRTYHIVFSTYRRYPILVDEKRLYIEKQIQEILVEKGISVKVLNVLSDHVHMLLHKQAGQSLPVIMQAIKGITTYRFFEEFPETKADLGKGRLWAKGYNETRITSAQQYENTVRYIERNYDNYLAAWNPGVYPRGFETEVGNVSNLHHPPA